MLRWLGIALVGWTLIWLFLGCVEIVAHVDFPGVVYFCSGLVWGVFSPIVSERRS